MLWYFPTFDHSSRHLHHGQGTALGTFANHLRWRHGDTERENLAFQKYVTCALRGAGSSGNIVLTALIWKRGTTISEVLCGFQRIPGMGDDLNVCVPTKLIGGNPTSTLKAEETLGRWLSTSRGQGSDEPAHFPFTKWRETLPVGTGYEEQFLFRHWFS